MINLLPPQEKEKIYKEQINRMIIIWSFIIIVFLIALALNLWAISIQLQNKITIKQIVTNSLNVELENPIMAEAEQEIQSFSRFLSIVKNLSPEGENIGFVLEKLDQALPENSYLLRFSYNLEDGLIEIKVFIPTREELRQLKNNLEKDVYFSDIEFPGSTLTESENIEFTAKLTISKNGN